MRYPWGKAETLTQGEQSMPKKQYHVQLTPEDRITLKELIGSGREASRTLTHARILLKADISAAGPGWGDAAIVKALEVSASTVERVRRQYHASGLAAALHRRPPRRQYHRKVDGEQEALLVALACSAPPDGQQRWSLRLLADSLIELTDFETLAHETVRRVLKKTNLSLG